MTSTKAGAKEWWGLAVLALPTMMTSIDLFVLLLALPQITSSLKVDSVGQLWVTDIYGFLLAGFLVTMGTLGDRVGRRKILLFGSAAFGAASVLAAFSTSVWTLLAARAILGVAGATIAPSTLSLISHMFRDDRERAVGIGVWLICLMGGAALGPLVGGFLLAHFSWGSVFLIGVPPMVLILLLGLFVLPEYRAPNPGKLHWAGVGLSLAAILPLVFGIKELARGGWQPLTIAALLIGLVLGVLFVFQQLKAQDPLLDLRLFKQPTFSVLMVAMFFNTLLPGGTMVIITQYLQLVAGLTPLQAGLWLLPGAAASIAGFQLSPQLAKRIRPGLLVPLGLIFTVAGLIVLSQATVDGLGFVILGLSLFNLGAGPLLTLGTNLIMGAAPPERAGSVAAVSQTGNELGFALGIAVVGSLAAAANHSWMGAQVGAGLVPDPRQGFVEGLHWASAVSAAVLAVVAVVLWRTLRRLKPLG